MPDDIPLAGDLVEAQRPAPPDPHGEAALMLVESLIHELLARSIVSHADALNVIQIAIDAQLQVSDSREDPRPHMPKAAQLLSTLYASVAIDIRLK